MEDLRKSELPPTNVVVPGSAAQSDMATSPLPSQGPQTGEEWHGYIKCSHQ